METIWKNPAVFAQTQLIARSVKHWTGRDLLPGRLSPSGLAEKVFQMNVTPGHTTAISGLTAALDQPEFATGIGLLKYGSLRQRKHLARPSLVSGIKGVFGKLLTRS